MQPRMVRLGLVLVCCIASPLPAVVCQYVPRPAAVVSGPGQVQFIPSNRLHPLLEIIPNVSDPQIQQILKSVQTMWYDEESLTYVYQDSEETVTGVRANCVGRDVGERNRDNPGIAKLLKYFGPDGRFMFPFRTAAGTDDATNVKTLNFWHVPRKTDGSVLPVRWWRQAARKRWNWVFPIGTILGEVLLQTDQTGKEHVFEIRVRKRYSHGWDVDVFRPYVRAAQLSNRIKVLRPEWQTDENLRTVVTHLENPLTLERKSVPAGPFAHLFPNFEGSLDVLPEIKDGALVEELLQTPNFVSAQGEIWKEGNGLETYAASSAGGFSIVPPGYKMGLIAVNEISCNRCHEQTGMPLVKAEFDVILYGELWGEDRAFTWHLFEANRYIFSTWDESDGSRKINNVLVQAGLVTQGQPAANDLNYRALPKPYEGRLK